MKTSERIRELARLRYMADLDRSATSVGTEDNYRFGALLDVLEEIRADDATQAAKFVEEMKAELGKRDEAIRESAATIVQMQGDIDTLKTAMNKAIDAKLTLDERVYDVEQRLGMARET